MNSQSESVTVRSVIKEDTVRLAGLILFFLAGPLTFPKADCGKACGATYGVP